MYRADKLYNDMMAVDTAIKQLKVEDEASLAEYFRLYTELIFNHMLCGEFEVHHLFIPKGNALSPQTVAA